MGHRERKKRHTRQQLTDAAFRLFGEQGYDQTTVDEIADSAMVSSRTFFRYFDTKSAVLAEPVSEMIRSLGADLRAAGTRRMDQCELMRLLSRHVTEGLREGRLSAPVRVVRENEELERLGAAWRHRWSRELAQELASLKDRVGPTFEERMIATAAVSLMGCALDEWVGRNEEADLQALTEDVIATLWPDARKMSDTD